MPREAPYSGLRGAWERPHKITAQQHAAAVFSIPYMRYQGRNAKCKAPPRCLVAKDAVKEAVPAIPLFFRACEWLE